MELIDYIDVAIIKEIQEDIPLTIDPFEKIARKAGCSKDQVLERLRYMEGNGILRRIGAILRHNNAGFKANGMLVCVVSKKQLEEAGNKLSSILSVSHCYQRKAHDDWPYNLYAMIHGRTRKEVEDIVEHFIKHMCISQYRILFSTNELKKVSIKYF